MQRELIDTKITKAKAKNLEKSGVPTIPKKYRVWRSDNIRENDVEDMNELM